METKQFTQKDIVDELNARTGFYKYNIRALLEELDDVILEFMNTATVDEAAEIILFNGWRLGAKRMPERPYVDPRNQAQIITPEKLIPYCRLKQSYRQRLNKWEPKPVEEDEEEVNDE